MLSKKYRLLIQSVLNKSGRSLRSRSFLLKIFQNKESFNRFGVVISKKVDKSAVKRNRLKRIIFEGVKNFVCQSKNNENSQKLDVLIILSPAVAKMEKTDIIRELTDLLCKLEIRN